jgi:hypothetical protein
MEQIWASKQLVNGKAIVVWAPHGPVNGMMPSLPKKKKK